MGANLYIEKIKDGDEGYFRDCYNEAGLFSVLSATLGKTYSWWQLSGKKRWFTVDGDEGRMMTIQGALEFMDMMLKAKKEIEGKDLYRRKWVPEADYDKLPLEKFEANRVKEYTDWLDELIAFLKRAIESDSKIGWSV